VSVLTTRRIQEEEEEEEPAKGTPAAAAQRSGPLSASSTPSPDEVRVVPIPREDDLVALVNVGQGKDGDVESAGDGPSASPSLLQSLANHLDAAANLSRSMALVADALLVGRQREARGRTASREPPNCTVAFAVAGTAAIEGRSLLALPSPSASPSLLQSLANHLDAAANLSRSMAQGRMISSRL
jgi:hypothetical protein